jgi:hypothetical protein
MNQYKSIFASTTFWGSIVSLVAMFAPKVFLIVGLTPNATGQATAVTYIISGIGFLVTVYGRLTATKVATITGAPPATLSGTKG